MAEVFGHSNTKEGGQSAGTDGFFGALKRRFTPAPAPRYAPAPAPSADAGQFWSEYRPDDAVDAGTHGPICAVGFDVEGAERLDTMLTYMSLGGLGRAAGVAGLDALTRSTEHLGYLFVNLDGFDDLEDAVDALLAFRAERPEAVVIILSGDLLVDDLDGDRKAICDASLRAPVSFERFKAGISAAAANHSEMMAQA